MQRGGYSLTEVMITLALISVAVAMAVPSLNRSTRNNELRDTALALDGGLTGARGEAIRTGDVHLFFLFQDAEGNPLLDANGNPVPALIVNDGAPGSPNQNCHIDDGETTIAVHALKKADMISAPPAGSGQSSLDLGQGDISTGTTFVDPAGNSVTWVMFRPEGMPIAFNQDCTLGLPGSGAGSIYMKNEERAFMVALSPMGTTKVAAFNQATGAWE
jgi:prepilin-type N-terminal cleavage/methylation domain-containing protein